MQDSDESRSLFVKTVENKIDNVVLYRAKTHWYRYDPNRPTLDQLREAKKDRKRRRFQEKRRNIIEAIKCNFKKLKFW